MKRKSGKIRPEKSIGRTVSVFAVLLLFSCRPPIPQERTSQVDFLPEKYSLQSTVAETGRWWETFGDPQLNSMIEEALSQNLTLREHWARVEQARARALKSGALLLPEISGNADASYSRSGSLRGGSKSVESYSHGIFASYELDLWGRVRFERESERLNVSATREDLNATAVTIAAEIAERWVRIISQENKTDLLNEQLEANKTYLELVELRFNKGLASALDVLRQRQMVERTKAEFPLMERNIIILRNELAVLMGKPPHASPVIESRTIAEPDPVPPAGIPADLLANRPDVRAAFFRLRAADQSVAASKADRLPAIRLTGSARFDGDALDRLFDNWLLNLAASLTAPLFDGGRRDAEVVRSEAVVRERIATCRKTILNAIREVEDALIREEKLREHINRLSVRSDTAKKALNEAVFRYRNGLNDYLPVLTQLMDIQQLDTNLADRKAELVIARLNLYRALGKAAVD